MWRVAVVAPPETRSDDDQGSNARILSALATTATIDIVTMLELKKTLTDRWDLALVPAIQMNDGGKGTTLAYRSFTIDHPMVIAYGAENEIPLTTLASFGVYDFIPTTESQSWYVDYFTRLRTQLSFFAIYPLAIPTNLEISTSSTNWVIENPKMREVDKMVTKLAAFQTTVLIYGESGTGKELVARELHTRSHRSANPFIAINCGAIPENLIESELFGHKRGSFTDATSDKKGLFEEANNGTLFLDEVGEMPLHLQVKLLRALQERRIQRVGDEEIIPINVRVVAATLRNLEQDVADGRFRDDLLYRLNVVTVQLPPLRERTDEIPSLVKHFITKHAKRLGIRTRGFTDEALATLKNYEWRGNIRELENCVERAMVLSKEPIIGLDQLPPSIRKENAQVVTGGPQNYLALDTFSIKEKTKELEKALISKALEHTRGNRTKAAKVLEISHRALLYKLKEYQFD